MVFQKEDINLSMAGCGFLGIYHVGISACLQAYAPDFKHRRMAGASAGAMAAVGFLCDVPAEIFVAEILEICAVATSKTLGLLHPSVNSSNMLRKSMETHLPLDAHLRVNGKIHISMTRVTDRKNFIFSEFESREDLIQAIMCSGFIPVFSGWLPPLFRGERYMDGGWTDNLPVLDHSTVTVSPFSGESDICPKDSATKSGTTGLFNINLANTSIDISKANMIRMASALFPSTADILVKTCEQGFADAVKFLVDHDFIRCDNCSGNSNGNASTTTTTTTTTDGDDEGFQEYETESLNGSTNGDCVECQMRKDSALKNDKLPQHVLNVIHKKREERRTRPSSIAYVAREAAMQVGAFFWKISYIN